MQDILFSPDMNTQNLFTHQDNVDPKVDNFLDFHYLSIAIELIL